MVQAGGRRQEHSGADAVKERQQQLEVYARLAWVDSPVDTANLQSVPSNGSKPAPAQVN
jgi:hypothetical protein